MSKERPSEVERLYAEMAALTLPECATACRVPFSCCSKEYCEFAEDYAKSQGVTIERTSHEKLPFMGPQGCTMPPHLRPMCTLHTCEINSLGFKRNDVSWTQRYFKLRAKIERAEIKEFNSF